MPRPITSLIHKFFKKCGKESICQCLVVPSKNELEPEDSDEDDINNNEIKMIACGAIIQGNFITNLKRHVQAKHPTEWNEFIEFSNEKTPQLPQSTRNHASQPLLTKHISVKKMSISINCSYESIEDAAVTMVTVDGRPFSCVEDTGFRKIINPMIAAMNMREKSNFTMHRKKVRDLVESYVEKMRNDITAVVQNRYVSLQIDCVTKNQRAFIGINAQLFINGKFILISLGVVELKEKHTSDYLKKVILNEVKRFGITEKFIYAVTTDNGANLVKCVKTLKSNNESTTPTTSTSTSNQNGNTTTNTTTTSHESEHDSSSYAMNDNQEFDFDYSVSVFEYSEAELSYSETPILCEDVESECLDLEHIWNSSATVCIRCGAHTLQLSVRDAVKDSGDTLPTINRAREVVKKLRTPRINMMLQKYTTIRPVLDVETRWMSSYDMIFRLLQIKTSVQQLSAIPDLALSEEEWVELESISKCLKAAKEATIELQRSDLTLTDLYGIWVECKLQTEKIDHPLAKSLVTELEARENMLMDNITFKSAMLLDLRYCFVLSKYDQIAASRHITDLYIEMKLTKKAPEMEKNKDTDTVPEELVPSVVRESYSNSQNSNDSNKRHAQLKEYLDQQKRMRLNNIDYRTTADSLNATEIIQIDKWRKKIEKEIDNFSTLVSNMERSNEIDLGKNAMVFWNDQKENSNFLALYKVVTVIFAVPVTQVSVERLFSDLSFIYNKLRSNLDPEIIRDLLLLRFNYSEVHGFDFQSVLK